ncbi:MAG TPA: response regulator transcription factor [Vicinamibacterales bacterium]|nr:response regulator transcription factor [Vicinamibacterales bacterium]
MAGAARPRVLLADDHPALLKALRRLLQPACDVVGEVTVGTAVVDATQRLMPDVVVLDLAMPELNGLEACCQITNATPQTKVVILTATDDPDVRQRAIEMGAFAFVLKQFATTELPNAIERAVRDAPARRR